MDESVQVPASWSAVSAVEPDPGEGDNGLEAGAEHPIIVVVARTRRNARYEGHE